MPTYTYREDGYDEDFEAADDTAASAIGAKMLRDGEHGEIAKTTRVRAEVYTSRTDDEGENYNEVVASLAEDLEPAEPRCAGPEHEWRDGGKSGGYQLPLVGHGGGVISRQHCAYCLVTRVTDTWDTDPADGSVMQTLVYEDPTEDAKARPATVTFWVTDVPQPRAAAVQPELEGIRVPGGVWEWVEGLGLGEDDRDVYVLVSTLDRGPVAMDGWHECLEAEVTTAAAAKIAAATAVAERGRAEQPAHL